MKEISIKIDNDLYHRVSRKVEDLDAEVSQHVTEYLETLNSDDAAVFDARTRMAELFKATRNFGLGVRPSRKEMHEREGIH
jgi:DNA replication initiation complex subunit (GINS family)